MSENSDISKEIWFFEYLDHAYHIGDPKEAMKNPYKLWCVGIVVEENKEMIMLRNSGSTSHEKHYSNDAYELIVKKAIISKKLLGIIGEDIELR